MQSVALVVDDQAVIVRHVSRILRGLGFKAIGASCGDEALEKADEEQIDLVITDMRMPGMDGIEVLRALAKTESYSHSIIMSGWQTSVSNEDKQALKIAAVLTKPFSATDLQSVLDKIFP
jgi:two-component system response regulator (stage 0 sporulation protein F)